MSGNKFSTTGNMFSPLKELADTNLSPRAPRVAPVPDGLLKMRTANQADMDASATEVGHNRGFELLKDLQSFHGLPRTVEEYRDLFKEWLRPVLWPFNVPDDERLWKLERRWIGMTWSERFESAEVFAYDALYAIRRVMGEDHSPSSSQDAPGDEETEEEIAARPNRRRAGTESDEDSGEESPSEQANGRRGMAEARRAGGAPIASTADPEQPATATSAPPTHTGWRPDDAVIPLGYDYCSNLGHYKPLPEFRWFVIDRLTKPPPKTCFRCRERHPGRGIKPDTAEAAAWIQMNPGHIRTMVRPVPPASQGVHNPYQYRQGYPPPLPEGLPSRWYASGGGRR